MSGPKAVGISPLVPAIVPIALVVGAAVYGAAALAALAADYISYRRNLSRYRMLAEEWERIYSFFQEQLRQVEAAPSFSLELSMSCIRQMEEAEAVRTRSDRALEKIRGSIEQEINATHKRLLEQKLLGGSAPVMSLAKFLAKQPPPKEPEGGARAILGKVDRLLAQVAVLQDTGGWMDLMAEAGRIGAEPDGQRRQMLYENLALECDGRLKRLRETERWLCDVDKLLEEAAPYEEMVVDEDLSMLQTTMVRHAETEEMSDQQRLRDKEREEAWCADHARLREKMAANGMETQFKLKIAAGEHPVKVVVDKKKGADRGRVGIEEKRQGQRTL